MHEASRRARVRARRAGARPARESCARRSSASRWSAPREEDYDLIGIAEDELEASVQVFYVRKGRVVGRKGLVVDKVEDVETPALVARVVEQLYADAPATTSQGDPRPVEPEDLDLYEEFLALQPGSKVRIRVPQRGDEARAARDRDAQRARRRSQRHKLKRASDHNARARALVALQDALDLPEAPLRIECFDISNIQGTEIVGVDGRDGRRLAEALRLPPLQGARRSTARTTSRRWKRCSPAASATTSRERDEGAHAGQAVLATRRTCCSSTAARVSSASPSACSRSSASKTSAWRQPREAVRGGVPPGRADPVRIPRDSEALYLLQQVRDEAHRFAITYHRQLRGKTMTRSVLDDVAGLGPTRRPRLLQGVRVGEEAARTSLEEDLVALPWLPDAVARPCTSASTARARPASGSSRVDGRCDDRRRRSSDSPLDVTIITGMSGAGRSEAADVLEDLGFFVIDNLPPALIAKVAELAAGDGQRRPATRSSSTCAPATSSTTSQPRSPSCASIGARTRILFLDASDEVLVAPLRGEPAPAPARRQRARQRRHRRASARSSKSSRARPTSSSTRRRSTCTSCATGCASCSASEPTAAAADERRVVRVQARPPARRRPRVRLPLPPEPALGRGAAPAHRDSTSRCATTCSRSRETGQFLERARPPVRVCCCPRYEHEGKSYLSIGVGCTGGRHRSVVIAEELARVVDELGYRPACITGTSSVPDPRPSRLVRVDATPTRRPVGRRARRRPRPRRRAAAPSRGTRGRSPRS